MTVHDASVLIPQMRPDGCALVGGAHHHQTWNFELRGECRLREGLDAAHIVSRDQVRIELDPFIEESRWLSASLHEDSLERLARIVAMMRGHNRIDRPVQRGDEMSLEWGDSLAKASSQTFFVVGAERIGDHREAYPLADVLEVGLEPVPILADEQRIAAHRVTC